MSLGYAADYRGCRVASRAQDPNDARADRLDLCRFVVRAMAVQEGEGVAWLAVHVGLIVGALLLVRHNRYVLWADKGL